MSISSTPNNITQTSAITVTDSAAYKVYELIDEEGNPELKLRAFVIGGGCSGFQYGFSFEEQKGEDDFEIIKKIVVPTKNDATVKTDAAIKLLVDAQSFSYLKGAEIDYCKDINGERFIIRNNPNAKTTCGCGSSFAAADE